MALTAQDMRDFYTGQYGSEGADALGGVPLRGQAKALLRDEVAALRSGQLGMSEAEKRQQAEAATLAGTAAASAAAQGATRDAITAGDAGGALTQAQLAAQQNAAMAAGSQAMAGADAASRAQANERYAAIRQALERQQDRARENTQQAVGTITSATGGLLTSPESSVAGTALKSAFSKGADEVAEEVQ